MKNIIIVFFTLQCISAYSQKEGQLFCEGDETQSYFTLLSADKIIYWYDTHYVEKRVGLKTINNKEYIEYSQTWDSGFIATLYLRQDNGKTFQYESCCDDDTLRFDDNFKNGDTWTTADGLVEYEILATNVSLKTPVCEYKNLVQLKYTSEASFFEFYYLQGFGYVGASVDGNLISCASAELLTKK